MSDFQKEYSKVKSKIDLLFKRIYVICFNFYAWFWLYRQIFIRHSTDIEGYVLWAFMTFGMYYFVLDNHDVFIKKKKDKS